MDALPSKADRLALYRTVIKAAEHILDTNLGSELPSTATTSYSLADELSLSLSRIPTKDDPSKSVAKSKKSVGAAEAKLIAARERYRRRMITVLKEQVPQQVGTYLLLDSYDWKGNEGGSRDIISRGNDGESRDSISNNDHQPSDPLGCIALLLANHIIHCDMTGYDARTRSLIRMASVHVLAEEMKVSNKKQSVHEFEKQSIAEYTDSEATTKSNEPTLSDMLKESMEEIDIDDDREDEATCTGDDDDKLAAADARQKYVHFLATRKFEATEQAVGQKVLQLLLAASAGKEDNEKAAGKTKSTPKNTILRSVKIGAAGVAAGTLLAVTGGLAAPGIAAGVAALGIGTTAALTMLTSTTMMATLFGIGGGGLTAYKMKRRTDGLSEFRLRREGVANSSSDGNKAKANVKQTPELRTAICISGWLSDKLDFQRPWGVTPTEPPLTNKLELLKRFFSVHNPEMVFKSELILKEWKGKEEELWNVLKQQYGRDPDHLLPIEYDSLGGISLTKAEEDFVGEILSIVCVKKSGEEKDGKGKKVVRDTNTKRKQDDKSASKKTQIEEIATFFKQNSIRGCIGTSLKEEEESSPCNGEVAKGLATENQHTLIPHHMKRFDDDAQPTCAWDFLSLYGGELYTVTWESDQLLQLSDIVKSLVRQMANTASKEVLKQTVLATLLSAISFPSTLIKFAGVIDEPWSLISMKADEAGIELANCLLQSEEHKPISLVGFSFGARILYSALKELARHQEIWERQQEMGPPAIGSTSIQSDKSDKEVVKYSREPASIVEDAVLMGTPKFVDKQSWLELRRVVAGRLINCYSTKDWILSLLFQVKNVTGIMRPTVGTSPIKGVGGVQNYDVTDLITSHDDYTTMVQQILRVVGYGEPSRMLD